MRTKSHPWTHCLLAAFLMLPCYLLLYGLVFNFSSTLRNITELPLQASTKWHNEIQSIDSVSDFQPCLPILVLADSCVFTTCGLAGYYVFLLTQLILSLSLSSSFSVVHFNPGFCCKTLKTILILKNHIYFCFRYYTSSVFTANLIFHPIIYTFNFFLFCLECPTAPLLALISLCSQGFP